MWLVAVELDGVVLEHSHHPREFFCLVLLLETAMNQDKSDKHLLINMMRTKTPGVFRKGPPYGRFW